MYLKMDSMETAMKAYKALHGGWYKGEWHCKNLFTLSLWAICIVLSVFNCVMGTLFFHSRIDVHVVSTYY